MKTTIIAVMCMAALVACGPSNPTTAGIPQQAVQQAPVAQAAHSDGFHTGDAAVGALAGAAAGYMMGRSSANTAQQPRTIIVDNHRPSYYDYGSNSKRSTIVTTTKRSLSGRTVTRTTTRR